MSDEIGYSNEEIEGYDAFLLWKEPCDCPYNETEIMGVVWIDGWTKAKNEKFKLLADMTLHWGKLVDECMKIFAEAAMWDDYEKIKEKIENGPGWNS
jgi:hypothetical protein